MKWYRHWPFLRECHTAAIFEKIRWALQHSESPIMVRGKITTQEEMKSNLRCFSEQGLSDPYRGEDAVPMPSADNIRRCYGWIRLPRESLAPDFHNARAYSNPDFYEESTHYYALVYDYVKCSQPEQEYAAQDNLDFFYHAGFRFSSIRPSNWRSGKLVDFGDLLSPFRDYPWKTLKHHRFESESFFGRRGTPMKATIEEGAAAETSIVEY
jgi:hypothetical protein